MRTPVDVIGSDEEVVLVSERLLGRVDERLFEVEDQGVGAAVYRTRELALGIAGNEQQRPQSHHELRELSRHAATRREAL